LKKILFIINRKAGTDREKRLEHAISRHLPADQYEVSTAYLAYLGHGADLAREAVQNGIHIVVAVGGDGSINEISQGLVGSNTAMAILPLGSGNGLARALKIPLNIDKALQLIVSNKQRAIDVGYANEHLFLSNAGVGFDALIAEQFRHNTKRGLSGYAKLVLKSFNSYEPAAYNVEIDGESFQTKAFLLTVANGNQFGYEFKLAPKASVFDGQLDICIMPPVGIMSLLPVSIFSLMGNIDHTRYIKHYTGKDIIIRSSELQYLQVDGDAVPLSEKGVVRIRIQTQAINLVVNE
jgi:diacylglycerol kinase (ATP)